MGLDMYLKKTKKVDGITAELYNKIDNHLAEIEHPNHHLEKMINNGGNYPLEPMGIEEKLPIVVKGTHFHWYSITKNVGYWRKANQIHRWFVEHIQNGVDECDIYFVTKEDIQDLLGIVNVVLENNDLAPELLPTQSGFFFGGTEYDEWYFWDLKETKKILKNILNYEMDWDKEVLMYHSSW